MFKNVQIRWLIMCIFLLTFSDEIKLKPALDFNQFCKKLNKFCKKKILVRNSCRWSIVWTEIFLKNHYSTFKQYGPKWFYMNVKFHRNMRDCPKYSHYGTNFQKNLQEFYNLIFWSRARIVPRIIRIRKISYKKWPQKRALKGSP
jgi:hypothetical protein